MGGLPALEVGGRRGLVWELSEELLETWVLVLKNTGLAVNK